MIGHEVITATLTETLNERVPAIMQRRMAGEAPALSVDIPKPEHIYPHPIPTQSIEGYPYLAVEEMNTGPRFTTQKVGGTGAVEVFETRYVFRVWCLVRGSDYSSTSYRQKYLATCLRAALLTRRCFLDVGEEQIKLDPQTFVESFSDVANDEENSKFIAGHYAEFELLVTETTEFPGANPELPANIKLRLGLMYQNSAEPIPPTLTDVDIAG
ncbi:hypothetical protein [Glutamicibacter sp. TV12E]|uniref:hypothetical protein n=1 Tax=Glutamicibacter sp. TV12E TaxID=3446362 RepID=UPI0040346A67